MALLRNSQILLILFFPFPAGAQVAVATLSVYEGQLPH